MEDGTQFLQSSYKTFVEKMNNPSLKQLLDYLYQEDMLTEAERDEIEARETQSDKNRNAFAIIINKGNKVHETVIQYLKDHHKHEYEAMAKAAEKKKMRFGQTQASTGSQSDIEKYTDEHLEEIIKNLMKEVGSKEVKRIENEVKDNILKKMWAFPPSTVHAIYKDKNINSFLTKEASECSGKAFPLTKVIGCLFIRRAKAKTNPQVDTSNNSSNESESMEDSIEESLTESRQENSPTGGKSMGTHSQSDMRETLRDNNPINNDSKDNCLNPPESISSEASNTGQGGSLDSGISSLSQNNTSKEEICDMEAQQSSVTVDDSRPAFTEDVPISEAFGKGLPAIKTLPQRSEKMQNKSVNKNDDTSLRKSQFSGTANPIPTENASPETSREVRTMVKSDPKDDEHSDNRVNQASADADVNSSACKESSPKKRKSKTQQEEEQKSGNRNKKRRSEKIDKLKTYFKETNIDKGSTLKCINYREHNECRLLNVHDSIVYYDVNSKQDVLLITETPKEKSDTSKDNQFSHILGLPKLYETQLQLRMGILGNIIRAHVLFSGNKKPPYKLGYKKTYFLDVLDTFKSFVVEILIPVLAVYKQSQKETILKDFE